MFVKMINGMAIMAAIVIGVISLAVFMIAVYCLKYDPLAMYYIGSSLIGMAGSYWIIKDDAD